MLFDQFYTPSFVAWAMLNAVSIKRPKIIADFSVGDGALLACAQTKWPSAKFYANDICSDTCSKISCHIANVKVSSVDFLDSDQIESDDMLSAILGKCDLILLNPPYSYRGQFKFAPPHSLLTNCPKSLAFVINSLRFLSRTGQLIALLPEGALCGDRSKKALDFIYCGYHIDIVEKFSSNTFPNCSAKTVSVKIHRKKSEQSPFTQKSMLSKYDVIRGNTSMHTVGTTTNGVPLVHSTSLTSNGLQLNGRCGTELSKTITGPALLIQRVGKFQNHKICMYYANSKISLSDCIIAIKANTKEELEDAYNFLSNNIDDFLNLYTGTCANFITIEKVHHFFAQAFPASCDANLSS